MASRSASGKLIANAQTPSTSSSVVINLDVGGRSYKTTTATLLCPAAAGSILAEVAQLHVKSRPIHSAMTLQTADTECPNTLQLELLASGPDTALDTDCSKDQTPKPAYLQLASGPSPALCINRDGILFAHILTYLRTGGHLVLPRDSSTCQQLLEEAEYYRIQGLVDLLKRQLAMLSNAEVNDHAHAKQIASLRAQKQTSGRLQKMEQGVLELRELRQRLHGQLQQQRLQQQEMHKQLQQQRTVLKELKQDIITQCVVRTAAV